MKKIILLLLVIIGLNGCELLEGDFYKKSDVKYSVTGGDTASVSYISESGDVVHEDVVLPWEYVGAFYKNSRIGLSAKGETEINATVYYLEDGEFKELSSLTSDKLILIFIYLDPWLFL